MSIYIPNERAKKRIRMKEKESEFRLKFEIKQQKYNSNIYSLTKPFEI